MTTMTNDSVMTKAEEKARIETTRQAQDAQLDARIATLKTQLADVRSARQQMRIEVAKRTAAPAPSHRGNWIAGTMAAASLVAAVTATMVAWPRAEVTVAVAPITSLELETTPVAVATTIELAPPVPAPVEVAAAPVVVAPVAEPPRVRRVRARHVRATRTRRDLGHQLSLDDGDSVLSDSFLNGAGN